MVLELLSVANGKLVLGGNNIISRYILTNGATSTNNCVIADGHTFENDRIGTNPTILTNSDWSRLEG